MKRFAFCIVVIAAAALVGAAWAGQDKEEHPLRLELDLVDGSRVIGIPSIESVPVQTSYAKIDVQLKQILGIRIGEDHETASLDLQNGDKLKGVINLGPVKLETVFGKVSIGVEHIRALRVVPSGGALPEALKRGLVLHYTFDKDEGDKVTDESGKGHTGMRHGGKWAADGPVGGALALAVGTEFITTSDAGFPDGDKPRSLAWWFHMDSFPPGCWGSGMSYGTGEYNRMASFGVDRRVGRCNFCFSQYGGVFLSAARVSTGTWHHVVYTYGGGGRHTFYVDSRLSNGVKEIGAVNTLLGGTFKIGDSELITGGTRSVATFDDLRVYDRELSDEEAQRLFEAGVVDGGRQRDTGTF